MHDDESAFRVPQDLHIDAIGPSDLLVLLRVRESFFLDSGDVEDIGLADHLFEAVCRAERQSLLLDPFEDLRRHLERRRAHEGEMGSELREGVRERVDRATVLEVADQRDVLSLERALFVPDRV